MPNQSLVVEIARIRKKIVLKMIYMQYLTKPTLNSGECASLLHALTL